MFFFRMNYNSSSLKRAIESKNIKDLEENINTVDLKAHGGAAITSAIEVDNFNIVKILIKRGAIPESRHVSKCIEENKIELGKRLIEMGANTCSERQSDDPLWVAISKKNIEMVEFLLDNGAQFKMHTGLMKAIEENNLQIVQLLLKKGASVNFEYKDGGIPLLKTLKSLGIVQFLLKSDDCVNFRNRKGLTPLLQAVTCNPVNLEIVEELIKNGVNVNLTTKLGAPLFHAVKSENVQLVDKMIRSGGDINKSDANGNYPIMAITASRDLEMLKFLIENKVNLDVKDQNGDTPFVKSVRIRNWPMVKHLVARGVDVNQKTKKNETPLSVALSNYDLRMFEYLMKSGADRHSAAAKIAKLVKEDQEFALCLKAVEEDIAKKTQENTESTAQESDCLV